MNIEPTLITYIMAFVTVCIACVLVFPFPYTYKYSVGVLLLTFIAMYIAVDMSQLFNVLLSIFADILLIQNAVYNKKYKVSLEEFRVRMYTMQEQMKKQMTAMRKGYEE